MLREMREDKAVTDISASYFQTAYKQQTQVIPICIVCVTLRVLCLSPCHHQACCEGCHYNLNESLLLCLSACRACRVDTKVTVTLLFSLAEQG